METLGVVELFLILVVAGAVFGPGFLVELLGQILGKK